MSDNTVLGFLLGLAVGYGIWGQHPAYIKNAIDNESGSDGSSYVLIKNTFGVSDQIAIVHGLMDDFAGCETFRNALERQGGVWGCLPANAIKGDEPWWKFW